MTGRSRDDDDAATVAQDGIAPAPAPATASSESETPTRTAMGLPARPRKTKVVLPRGTTIGRYMLLEPVGEGGMGVVYRAFDPELDRSVAVKLIRSAEGTDEARARLLREAQALARLSHPNVVGVHDVGAVGDQVFLAMEMLDGQTLRDWLKTATRSWKEIVRAFADAGRGLAAAHRAGLVHRDFKPSNAFVETSGRVRLLDFGLARAADTVASQIGLDRGASDDEPSSSGPSTEAPHDAPSRAGGIYASITQAGKIAGTPRYMAPEQAASGTATALSDQYAFCVALCEALYARKPRPDIAERELRGPAPRRLRALVARGLRKDPAERWPTMDVVVAALDRGLVGRWPLAVATGLLAVVGAAAIALAARGGGPDAGERCRRVDQRMDTVWTTASADAIRSQFAATGRPYAPDAATRVVEGLGRYATAWRDARRDACEATWVRGEQSPDLLDRRMACLDRRLVSLRGYVGVVSQGGAEIVDRAVGALPTASDLGQCADAAALLAGDWPASPESRTQRAQLEAELEEASTLKFAGRYPEASAAARAVIERGKALGLMPLVAEATWVLGDIQQVASDPLAAVASLDEAITIAASAHAPKIMARAAILQVYVVGDLLGRGDEAIGLARMARAQTLLVGDPPRFVAALRNNLGNVYFEKGRYDEALGEYQATIAIELEEFGPEHIDVAWSWGNLGRVLLAQGKFAEAAEKFERAADIAERALGGQHPVLAPFLGNLALVRLELGEADLARRHVERSIAIVEAAGGRNRHRVAELLAVAADVADLQGRHGDALAACDEALAIDSAILDPEHTAIGRVLRCRGRALVGLGRDRDAVPVLERALAILTARSQDPLETAAAEAPLARALWASGNRTRAVDLAHKARAAYAAATGRQRQVDELDRWLAERR
jgi:tetratricopeptide (TPR) repeat protein/predicted Ser/Thr protein kinase